MFVKSTSPPFFLVILTVLSILSFPLRLPLPAAIIFSMAWPDKELSFKLSWKSGDHQACTWCIMGFVSLSLHIICMSIRVALLNI